MVLYTMKLHWPELNFLLHVIINWKQLLGWGRRLISAFPQQWCTLWLRLVQALCILPQSDVICVSVLLRLQSLVSLTVFPHPLHHEGRGKCNQNILYKRNYCLMETPSFSTECSKSTNSVHCLVGLLQKKAALILAEQRTDLQHQYSVAEWHQESFSCCVLLTEQLYLVFPRSVSYLVSGFQPPCRHVTIVNSRVCRWVVVYLSLLRPCKVLSIP